MGGAIQYLALFGIHLVQIAVAQAVGRELDWGQRVLDLMGQTTRHLAPGGILLCRDQFGDIIEDHHIPLQFAMLQ